MNQTVIIVLSILLGGAGIFAIVKLVESQQEATIKKDKLTQENKKAAEAISNDIALMSMEGDFNPFG